MKILIIANKLPYPPKDGGAIATLSLAKSLAIHNNEIDIIAINTAKHFFDIKQIPQELTNIITFHDYFLDTTLSFFKLLKNFLFSRTPYNAERFINKGFEKEIELLLNVKEFEIVQFEGLYVLPYIKTVRKLSKALISFRSHNVEHEIWQRTAKQAKNPLKKIYLKSLASRVKKFEHSYLNTYDILIPITERDAKKLNEFGNVKPHLTIPVGVDNEKVSKEIAKYEFPSIFHIGALDWSPNQQGLIWFINECWTKITEKYPRLKFYIAGRNAPESIINQFCKRNIVYLGEIDDAKIFMESKAVMIVPLLSGSGMRVKIIEAMALGKAIVSTSIGAEGIDITKNREILIADNADSFIKAISLLLDKQDLINVLGHNSLNFVSKNFDNFALSKKLIDFYLNHLKTST